MIREYEHYGIIERYLNQRSFVRVKVKTKKAELLFLDKTDIDNLSESYPQIWKKINKKSLFNYYKKIENSKNAYNHWLNEKPSKNYEPKARKDNYYSYKTSFI